MKNLHPRYARRTVLRKRQRRAMAKPQILLRQHKTARVLCRGGVRLFCFSIRKKRLVDHINQIRSCLAQKRLTDNRENDIEHFKNITSVLHLRLLKRPTEHRCDPIRQCDNAQLEMQLGTRAKPSKRSRTMTSLGLGCSTPKREKLTAWTCQINVRFKQQKINHARLRYSRHMWLS